MNEKSLNYNRLPSFKTFGDENIIESGSWSGLTAKGLFFTCFYPPSVPKVESPRPESYSAETFTPEFFFSNVSDGDEYLIEITYQAVNSGFTISSATSKYFYSKAETNNSTRRVANVEKTSFISETTRRASVPLVPGSTYYYRLGNVKYVVNLFGVKQSIISYTEATQSQVYSGQTIGYIVDSPADSSAPSEGTGGSGTQTTEYEGLPPQR